MSVSATDAPPPPPADATATDLSLSQIWGTVKAVARYVESAVIHTMTSSVPAGNPRPM